MEKNEVIKELRRITVLWTEINPLTEELTKVTAHKATATDERNAEAAKQYRYNNKIKIPNELPVSNAQSVEIDIAHRHKNDCLAAAQKKMNSVRKPLNVATIIGLIITLLSHIVLLMSGGIEKYNFFGNIGALGDFFLKLVFVRFTDQDGNIANMSLHRNARGGSAIMVIETDEPVPETIITLLDNLSGILHITYYEKEE